MDLLEQQTQSRITRAQTDYEKDKEMTISWFEALKNKTEEQQQKLQTKLAEHLKERDEAIAYHSSGKEGNKRAYAELLDFFKLGRECLLRRRRLFWSSFEMDTISCLKE